jgi:hypothetical protein
MGKGLARSLARGKSAVAPIIKQTIGLDDVAITVAAASTAVGFGTAVIGDFPAGNILFLGAVSYLRFTTADTDLTATFDGDYSIGTAPTADVTLSGSEVDVIPSTALGAATARVSPVARGASAAAQTGVIFDNTDGSLELNLNLLIDAASIADDTSATLTVDGVVYVSYIVLGDD